MAVLDVEAAFGVGGGSRGAAMPPQTPTSPTLPSPDAFLPAFLPLCSSPMAPRAGIIAAEDSALVGPLDHAAPQPSPTHMAPQPAPVGSLSMCVVPAGQTPPPHGGVGVASAGVIAADITPAAGVTCLHHHPHLPLLLSGGVAGQVCLWQHHGTKGVWRYTAPAAADTATPVVTARLTTVQWSSEGERVLGLQDDGLLRVWDASTPTSPLMDAAVGMAEARDAVWLESPHTVLVVGKAAGGTSTPGPGMLAPPSAANVHVLDVRTGGVALGLRVPGTLTRAVAGQQGVFLGDADGTLRLLDLRSLSTPVQSAPKQGHNGAVTCLALAPDDGTLASGGVDGWVKTWAASLGHPQQTVPAFKPTTFMGHSLRVGFFSTVGVTDLAFGDGHLVAAGASGELLGFRFGRSGHGASAGQ